MRRAERSSKEAARRNAASLIPSPETDAAPATLRKLRENRSPRAHMLTFRFRKQFLLLMFLLPAAWGQPKVDLGLVALIKTEAYDRSKVMDHLSWLSDVYGPRLTASREFFQAADWSAGGLREIGLSNVHLEPWGPFGRSWSAEQWSVEMVEPRYAPLNATPLAWSASTNGSVTGETILAPLPATRDLKKAREEFAAYRKEWTGKLRGKFVMLRAPKIPAEQTRPQLSRYTDAELADIAKASEHAAKISAKLADLKFPEDPDELRKFMASLPESVFDEMFYVRIAMATERNRFFLEIGRAHV